ncbi:PMS1 [[Candida] subhashii]|uniref:PMS1 n=1 Tax=[Candida] subhashii TaxID=561895 RepID=A0A8J5UUG1_9ASCO|nr:PMS1 [[Candida] subhashii]KAG7661655.1 PMS1 [[Candida] subhashii]
MNNIQGINTTDVSKITSGQVIIDLKAIIKELVENSIDAESTKIEIIFVNYGIDSISIQDNGIGINQLDFETVCLRNHTSKLAEFADLESLNTLGFRGEALNSICSISKSVSMITNTINDYPKNYHLKFDQFGKLSSKIEKIGGISNKSGTLIKIEQIFHNLPVRLKNFIKNNKREFQKSINWLINYLLIYPNIKFTIYNLINSKKQLILSTKGGKDCSIIDNLISIFGNNGNKNLLPISLNVNSDINLSGYISSYSFGLGRSTQDRQFLFINKRPIILKSLSKLINEVYKSFNHVQFPIFILNLEINTNILDVNLLPDKSQVLIHQESELLELIRQNLIEFYESQDNIIIPKNNNVSLQSVIKSVDQEIEQGALLLQNRKSKRKLQAETADEKLFEEDFEDEVVGNIDDAVGNISRKETELGNGEGHKGFVSREPKQIDILDPDDICKAVDEEYESEEVDEKSEVDSQNDITRPYEKQLDKQPPPNAAFEITRIESSTGKIQEQDSVDIEDVDEEEVGDIEESEEESVALHNVPVEISKSTTSAPLSSSQCCSITQGDSIFSSEFSPSSIDSIEQQQSKTDHCNHADDQHGINFYPVKDDILTIEVGSNVFEESSMERPSKRAKKSNNLYQTRVGYSSEQLLSNLKLQYFDNNNLEQEGKNNNITINQDLIDNDKLYHIRKSDFLSMKLIGQFNLGFILVNHHENNLFIIDQHASDEKFNFENLLANFQIKYQHLVLPKQLELNIIDEMTVIEHEKIFIDNGFKLRIISDNLPGKKVLLISLPIYQNIIFSLDDFYELINLINEQPYNNNIKCNKIRKIVAMKACRSSIMIGTSLSNFKMNQIVNNLSTLDKPWNCPHGRPTMRHLVELTNWKTNSYYDYEI